MGLYDLTLKQLVLPEKSSFIQILAGVESVEDIRNEVSSTRLRFTDALVRTNAGEIIHIEFQTHYKVDVPWRMLDYNMDILRRYGNEEKAKFPTVRQWVLYVGGGNNTIPDHFRVNGVFINFHSCDISGSVDIRQLAASPHYRDWVMLLLCMPKEYNQKAWRYVLDKVYQLQRGSRDDAILMLQIISVRRRTSDAIKKELEEMPFEVDALRESPLLKQAADHGLRYSIEYMLSQHCAPDMAHTIAMDLTVDEALEALRRLSLGEAISQIFDINGLDYNLS